MEKKQVFGQFTPELYQQMIDSGMTDYLLAMTNLLKHIKQRQAQGRPVQGCFSDALAEIIVEGDLFQVTLSLNHNSQHHNWISAEQISVVLNDD